MLILSIEQNLGKLAYTIEMMLMVVKKDFETLGIPEKESGSFNNLAAEKVDTIRALGGMQKLDLVKEMTESLSSQFTKAHNVCQLLEDQLEK